MKSNLTLQFGENERAECLKCGSPVVLIIAPSFNWELGGEQSEEGEVDLNEEITGRYCLRCGKLVSLSIKLEGAVEAATRDR